MNYQKKHIALFIVLLLTLAIVVHRLATPTPNKTVTKEKQITTVRVIHPQIKTSKTSLSFSARIDPIEEALLFSRANGFVSQRLVDIGDKVKAGDLLALLSSPEIEEKINQAEAQVKLQQAKVSLAKIQFDRLAILVKKGAASTSLYDESQASYQVALATLELNQAQLTQLKREFEYTRIVAPFDGMISQRNVEKGDRITMNDTQPLFKLIRINRLRVVVNIPETQLYAIRKNGYANLEFSTLPNKVFKATFSRMSNEVDLKSGTMRVEFTLDNANNELPAGLNGEVKIKLSDQNKRLTIPINCLSVREGKSSVVLVDSHNKIRFKTVVAGRIFGNTVEIELGLTPEDRVVINPNSLLYQDEPVQVDQ